MSDKKYVTYIHHGNKVKVRKDLKGKHRELCLCFSCKLLNTENREKNCSIANAVYDNCVKYKLTTPVTECPSFKEKDE